MRLFFNFKANEKERVKGSNVVCYLRLRSFKQGGGGERVKSMSALSVKISSGHTNLVYIL